MIRRPHASMKPSTLLRAARQWFPLARYVLRHHQPFFASSIVSRRPYSTEKPISWTQHPIAATIPTVEESNFSSMPTTYTAKTHIAYIALGSNLGDRISMIERACNEMSQRGIKVKRTSGLWETEPMYVLDQDKFLNGVCEVSTRIPYGALSLGAFVFT